MSLFVLTVSPLCAFEQRLFEDLARPMNLKRTAEDMQEAVIPGEVRECIMRNLSLEPAKKKTKDTEHSLADTAYYASRATLVKLKKIKKRPVTKLDGIKYASERFYNNNNTAFLELIRHLQPGRPIEGAGELFACNLFDVLNARPAKHVAVIPFKEDLDITTQDVNYTISWFDYYFLIAGFHRGVALYDSKGVLRRDREGRTLLDARIIKKDESLLNAAIVDKNNFITMNSTGDRFAGSINVFSVRDGKALKVASLTPKIFAGSIGSIMPSDDYSALVYSSKYVPLEEAHVHAMPNPLLSLQASFKGHILWLILSACKKENRPLNFQMIARHNPLFSEAQLEQVLRNCPLPVQRYLVKEFDIRKHSQALEQLYADQDNAMRLTRGDSGQ